MAKKLNQKKISWALGASLLLYLEGYEISVADIDIIVAEEDHEKLLEILAPYPYTYMSSNPKYQTKHFYTVEVDGVDFDFMIGFRVRTKNELYVFPHKVAKHIYIDETTIHLGSVSEWYLAYQAMDRDNKVTLIKEGIKKV